MTSLVVTVEAADAPVREMVFRSSPVRLGRGADNEVQLPFPFVSDRHGEVRFDEGGTSYVDLGSTNGTVVDGTRLGTHTPIPIAEELVIAIGTVTVAFRVRKESKESKETSFPPTSAIDASRLETAPTPPAGVILDTAPEDPQEAYDQAPLSPDPDEAKRDRYSPPTLFPGSVMRDPESGSKAASSPFLPPTIFPGSVRRAVEPTQENAGKASIGPPTLFPSGAPILRPSVDPAGDPPSRASGELRSPGRKRAGRPAPELPPASEPSILAWGAESKAAPSKAAPGPDERPKARSETAPPPTSSSDQLPTDSGELKRLKKLTRLMCDELVRLRKTCEAFGREVGIRAFPLSEGTRLHDLQDGEELARYLTHGPMSEARLDELKRLFADMAAHQLALMGAIIEGARGALRGVSPQNSTGGRPRLALFEDRRWNEHVEQFASFIEDDEQLQAAVFGPEFADAYAAARGK